MGRMRIAWGLCFLVFCSVAVRAGAAAATPESECRSALSGPQAEGLLRSVAAHPTAPGYDALGSLYANAHRSECAISAFQSALKIDPGSREAKYDLALALRLDGKLEQAEAELGDLVRADPDFAMGHEARAEMLAEEKRYAQAREEFETALRLDNRLSAASIGLVQLCLSQNEPQAAAYWATQALALNPDAEPAYSLKLQLGIAQGEAGKFDDAEKTLQALAEQYPERADPHLNLAIVDVHLQLYSEAIGEFSKVLELDPGNDVARLALAQADLLANRPDDALKYALEYTGRVETNPEGFSALARAYRALNRCTDAEAAYKKDLALRAGSYDDLFGLGMCELETGEKEKALENFRAAERVDATKPEVHYQIFRLLVTDKSEGGQTEAQRELATFKQLTAQDQESARDQLLGSEANASFDQGSPQKAAELYRSVLEANPRDANTHYNLSLALAQMGDREGELKELQAAIALDPSMTKAYNRLGLYEMQEGRSAEAVKDFQTVIDRDPASSDAKINLATVYGQTGRTADAESLLREVTEAAPDSYAAQLNLGLVLAGEGKWHEALIPLQAAARLQPANPRPLSLVGIIYGKMGDSAQSISYLKEALALSPDSAEAHLNLGIALADGYDLPGAAQQFAMAEKLAPTAAIVHYNVGRVAFDQGDQAKARAELEQATKLEPNYPGALQLLAQIDLHENQAASAVRRLREVLLLQPHNGDAEYLLGRALADLGRREEAVTEWEQALNDSRGDPRIYWALAHELPATDPRRGEYMARLKAAQGGQQNADRAKTMANIGIADAAAHEWAEAVEKMQQAIQICGSCPVEASLEQNLGLIYAEEGELRKAEQALSRSVAIDATTPDAAQELATVRNLEKQTGAHPEPER